MLKILILSNCHDCNQIGTNGVSKSKYCCITGDCVDGFDSDFLAEPIFPPSCPLKTFNPPTPIKDDDYV